MGKIRTSIGGLFTVLVFAGSLFSCSNSGSSDLNYGLISLLINNRITVIVKGTYATDRPLARSDINGNQLFVDTDDTTPDLTGLPSYSDLNMYFDMGEIRLSSKSFLDPLWLIDDEDEAEEFWDIVSSTRQVYCSAWYATITQFDGCMDTGGLINFVQFFNGEGAVYPSTDVGAASYLHSGLFVRALVTGWGREENEYSEASFDNNDVYGTNIMLLSNYDPGVDALEKAAYVPQFFPMHYMVNWGQTGALNLVDSQATTVLEIRMNVMENLMVHAFENSDGNIQTVVGFSDWLKPHADESDLGGNVLSRARFFYPDLTQKIVIEGGTASTRHYYAIYYESSCKNPVNEVMCDNAEQLPLAATPVRDGDDNTIEDLNTGVYILQCKYDEVYDGYPEKVLGEVQFSLSTGPGVTRIACACGASTTSGCD